MNKKVSLPFTVILSILTMLLGAIITLNITYKNNAEDYKYNEILKLMRENYYFEFDENTLKDGAYAGIVASLGDNYSYYMTNNTYSQVQKSRAGKTVLLGVSLARHPDTNDLCVTKVHPNSSAEKAGVLKGDIVLSINGTKTDGLTVAECVKLVVKEEGEKCTLSVMRDKKTLEITAVLTEFTESSIEYRTVENIGYIKITDFNSATTEQFKTAVDELKKQQVSAVIFDIRNNIGGLTSVCGDMLDEILGEGTAIRAKYKNGDIKPLESTTDGEWDIPMAVLTNGETASSAELFALAIRDYEKGILVGEKTYGKGVMQTSYTLNDGSAVKLTTAVLVDKNGETYNKIGITPDIEVAQSDYAKKYQNFLKDEDDTQLYKAIEQLKKSS